MDEGAEGEDPTSSSPEEEPPGQPALSIVSPMCSCADTPALLSPSAPSRLGSRRLRSSGTRVEALRGPSTGPPRRALARAHAPSEGAKTEAFRSRFYPEVSARTWSDWRWQARHRIRTLAQLRSMIALSEEEELALAYGGGLLPFGITPYYLSLVSPDEPLQPIRRTVIPTTLESVRSVGEANDPLGEDGHSPVPGLVHRYPDRVLLLAHGSCATYCRYCTRSRAVGQEHRSVDRDRILGAIEYIRRTPVIRDVLISGGDPLLMGEERLEWLLENLRSISHVEIIRLGSKVPAVIPQRVTASLCKVLRRFHPLWLSLHFTHGDECTPEAARACKQLADAGIPLGAQTVLLRGVNDDVATMTTLVHRLLQMRVRPYYLYQCDPVSGSAHFRTPVERGLEIIEGLRGHTSGYALPTYVIDAPGGGGKIPLQPNYVVGRDGDFLLLRNYEGNTYRYPDPLPDQAEAPV